MAVATRPCDCIVCESLSPWVQRYRAEDLPYVLDAGRGQYPADLRTDGEQTHENKWLQAVLEADLFGEEAWEMYCFIHGLPTKNPGSWDPVTNTVDWRGTVQGLGERMGARFAGVLQEEMVTAPDQDPDTDQLALPRVSGM